MGQYIEVICPNVTYTKSHTRAALWQTDIVDDDNIVKLVHCSTENRSP